MASTDPDPTADTGQAGVGRAFGWSVISSGGILFLGIATGVLLARELGPDLRGALAAALLVPSLVAPLGVIGLVEAISFFVARRSAPDGELLGSALALTIASSVVVTGASAGLVALVVGGQSPGTLTSAYLFLVSLPFTMVTLVLAGYVNGHHRFAWTQTLRVSVVLIAAGGLFIAAVFGHLDVRTAVLVYLAANLFTGALAIMMVKSLLNEPLTVKRATARELLAFGGRSFASTIAWRLNERIDQPFIAIFLAPAQLGLYVTAVTLASLALLIGSSIIFVALPVMSGLEDPDERRRLASALIGVTLIASVVLTLPLFVGTGFLLDLFFGHAFAVVAPVARILLVASVVISVNRAIESVLIGIGRPADAAKAELLTLPVTAVGLLVLLPLIGLPGAGWTSLAAYLTAFVLISRRAAKALGTTQRRLLMPGREDLEALVLRRRRSRRRGPLGADGAAR
ncbi:MAG: hypothetical protein QOH12_1057 [Solirubrobacteraceae bacterium]|nr:hypothetical protein [Solirubrobacteraceae bacterium]